MNTLLRRSALLLSCIAALAQARAADAPRHVVMIVWDGMRPDFVTEAITPNLYRLSREGVVFQNHHSVFVSSTEVNGTALGTGAHPHTSGVMANKEYRASINPLESVATEELEVIRKGDHECHDEYLKSATVAEILRAQKPAQRTTIAGSKPVVLLLDRKERPDNSSSLLLAEGKTLPASALAKITQDLGPFPAPNTVDKTKGDRDTWTARALLEEFWADGVPPYSVLWMAEPDFSQHNTGPGSETSLAAIKHSDDNLGLVLKTLAAKNALQDTDIMIVSDHGFSTIERLADLSQDLNKAGIEATKAYTEKSAPGAVLVVGNGGSANLYVRNHDAAIIKKAVEFLQTQDYTGVLFTRAGIQGTFPLSLAKIDTQEAPDIVISFHWSAAPSSNGTPGLIVSEKAGKRTAGQGNHASLSRYDLHNTLIAAGPHFRKGITDPLPTGNTDIAPTILWILGVKAPKPMDGRVLAEALSIKGPKLESVDIRRHEATHQIGTTTWHQYLTISEVNGTTYFDEGNGNATTAAATPKP